MSKADNLHARLVRDRRDLNNVLRQYSKFPNCKREASVVRTLIISITCTLSAMDAMSHVLAETTTPRPYRRNEENVSSPENAP